MVNLRRLRGGALGTLLVGGVINMAVASERPAGLLLTWQQDPTSTMTIDWHIDPERGHAASPTLRFAQAGTDTWSQREAKQIAFPYSDRVVYRIELTDLAADTDYYFHVGDFDRRYMFRTMPRTLDQPLVFATAGDTRHANDWTRLMRHVLDEHDPAFVVWAWGKAFYGNRPEGFLERWHQWFEVAKDALVDDEGRVRPVVGSISSQEVRSSAGVEHVNDSWRDEQAPFFYRLWAYPGQPGYGVLDFGTYLSLVSLDTETNPIEGEQYRWLETTLADRRDVQHVIPHYYLAAFPSDRDYYEPNREVRENWVPLFERNGIRLAIEESDMTYKRTPPIRNGRPDPRGVMYVGSGSWGAGGRAKHDPDVTWYLQASAPSYHCVVVTLDGEDESFIVVDMHGQKVDAYPDENMASLGLGTADAFVEQIASLLGEAAPAERRAGAMLLEAFSNAYDADRPADREAFLQQMLAWYDDESQDVRLRSAAYQVLLMHADDVEQRGALLSRGMNDASARIRAHALTVREADLSSVTGRLLLQTLGEARMLEMRERAFVAATNRPSPAFPDQQAADAFEKVDAFELPVEDWAFKTDPWRIGHLKAWHEAEVDESGWMSAELQTHWHHFLDTSYQGVGWYRRVIDVPTMSPYDAVGLQFDGVEENAWVWIDGHYVGQHNLGPVGWNVPFQFDVTRLITPGQSHQITIRVMNQRSVGGVWDSVRLQTYRQSEASE
ncbi:sugar-binding domain-containing protein [Phycisphaerales bacterium AB-hyl4]|uniref:Sugar-binding domain-containing protein n=1 Tax=Natronomicrosphaera hydrolytica TaxID=3242702 RepID=A0ABV4UB66_9BACT